jgi:hypothetical protein
MRSLKRDVKGQAAMEFLMTYGWAILAAVIAIAALAYFGVFSQNVPELCTINAPLGCQDSKINITGANLIVSNNVGSSLEISNFTVLGCGEYSPGVPFTLSAGVEEAINVDCTLSEGDTFSGSIYVEYLRAGDTFEKSTTGRVNGEVQAA